MPVDDVTPVLDDWVLTTLIVICVLLAVLCAIMVVAFILKTRALNRQLKAYEPAEFGSVASNLNRLGAPTTNIFSVEGSNPVINNRQYQKRGAYEEETR